MINPESQSRNSTKRVVARLNLALDKNLLAYATAASAAGVSLLALVQPAEAKIVYTPANIEITPRSMVNLDLNHDGVLDFKLSNVSSNTSQSRFWAGKLKVLPGSQKNAVWGGGKYASALSPGVSVGPKGKFLQGHSVMVSSFDFCTSSGYSCVYKAKGPWQNATRRYLGVKFVIQGKIHYGWARLDVTTTHAGSYALMTGYAYETVANKAIVTGKMRGAANQAGNVERSNPAALSKNRPVPAFLGLLARGAVGLDVWRRRDAIKG